MASTSSRRGGSTVATRCSRDAKRHCDQAGHGTPLRWLSAAGATSEIAPVSNQKMIFNPNWVERAAPEPICGLAFATSGVVREVPKPPEVVGLLCCPEPMVVAP